jgi:hypothetical protein
LIESRGIALAEIAMTQLLPCPSCARHVRQTEQGCPFCGVAIDLAAVAPRAQPTQRLGRAATFAFGAALATSVTACGGTGSGNDAGFVALYGAPSDTGAQIDSGSDGGGPAPAYGAPTDASTNDGSPAALYGAVPAPDSGTDAG